MKITIIQSDEVVGVDGAFRKVDVSDLDPTINAIHFDTVKGKGNTEFKGETNKTNIWLTDLTQYQVYVDRWIAAAPPPAPPARELVIVPRPTLEDVISVLTDEQKLKLGVHG